MFDIREKKVLFVSNCILNQNNRFPGIAVAPGIINEVLEILAENRIGIEQLPCLESMEWGGVNRKGFFKYLPIIFRYSDSLTFSIIKLFIKIWIRNYRKFCKREAKRIIQRVEDYLNSDYNVIGFLVMNDSPTCGVTKTINLLNTPKKIKELGYNINVFIKPKLEILADIIPSILEDGSGYFIIEIRKLLKKRNLDVIIIGFNPWNKRSDEIINIKRGFNLKL